MDTCTFRFEVDFIPIEVVVFGGCQASNQRAVIPDFERQLESFIRWQQFLLGLFGTDTEPLQNTHQSPDEPSSAMV